MSQANAPLWQRRGQLHNAAIPAKLKGWLCEERSLTRRLRLQCSQPFALQLISQRWEQPLADERGALGLRAGRLALVRQVRLLCGHHPLVFARSVIPSQTLRGTTRRLARLGNRPLADLLFTHRSVQRGEMEFTLLRPGHTLHGLTRQALSLGDEPLWGRRSLFLFRQKALLVSEMFSPAISLAAALDD